MEQKLSKSFYVDNFQHSVDSEIELSEVHKLLTSCMSKAGMPLQDWNSNSPVFNSKFSEDNRRSVQLYWELVGTPSLTHCLLNL